MQDFKPNPNRFNEPKKQDTTAAAASPEKKKAEKIISGKATAKPKGEIAKFFDTFFAEDIHKVVDYIKKDVVIPTIRDTLWTVIARGSERMIYGEAGHAPKNSKLPYVNYNGLFKQPSNQTSNVSSSNNQYSVDNIILEDRGDAERVLEAMKAYIAEFGAVSISDLYGFIGEPIGDFMTTRWGWRSLNTAGIMRTSNGGYKLDLPRAVSLK